MTSTTDQNELKILFDMCDKFCEEALSEQIQRLKSYFHLQLIRQFSLYESENEVNVDEYDEEQIIPDETQRLFIEYLCLPLLTLEEDVQPSNEFTKQFLQVLHRHYIDFYESNMLYQLVNQIVLPLCNVELNQDELNEPNIKKLKSLQVFINCYFASLVSICQRFLLRELGNILYLFNRNVRLWALRAFYIPVLNESFDIQKREIAKNVIINFKSDWSASLSWVSFFEPVHFLSKESPPNLILEKEYRSLPTTVGIAFCLKLLSLCSNELAQLYDNNVTTSLNQKLSKVLVIVRHCHILMITGDLKACISALNRLMQADKTKYKIKNKRKKLSFNSFDIMMITEECEQYLEAINNVWNSLKPLLILSSLQQNLSVNIILLRIMLRLIKMSNPVLSRLEMTNTGTVCSIYYNFMQNCILDMTSTLAKALQTIIEILQVWKDNENNFKILNQLQVKMMDLLLNILSKEKKQPWNIHSNFCESKNILSTLLSSVTMNNTPILFLIKISDAKFETDFIEAITDSTLIWASKTFFKMNSSDKDLIRNYNLIYSFLSEFLQVYIIQHLKLCKLLAKHKNVIKVNLVLSKLITCMYLLDYQSWLTLNKSSQQIQKGEQLRQQYILIRIGIAHLLKITGFYELVNDDNKKKLLQQ